MNADQIGGIIRAFIPVAIMIGAHFGFDSPTVTAIMGGVSATVVAAWSAYTNKPGTVIPPKTGA